MHSWPDLAAVGMEFGTETMIATAKASPKTFFAVCSKLIPKDVELTVRQHYSFDLDPADLEVLKAIREALSDANQRKPGEVFGVVLAALRAHNALLTVMRQSSHKSC